MYMKLKNGRSKVLTLSYDDGVVQDIRLIEILNKYGIKGTFNINSGLYCAENKEREKFWGRLKLSEAKELYCGCGQEIAVHGLTHPHMESLKTSEIVYEVMEDRKNIERDYDGIARGMAYPYGTYNSDVIKCLADCGICYSRTVKSTGEFGFPSNWLALDPTCHHNSPKLMELAKKFKEEKPKYSSQNWMFYLWGHSYEFDTNDNWNVIEEFCEYIGGADDIWYATNIEVYDYVKAYESLYISVDRKTVYNPTSIDVWVSQNGKIYCIKAGETVVI